MSEQTISVAPLTTTVISAVENRYAGTASGINNAVSRIATLLAVAVLGVIALAIFKSALDERLNTLSAPPVVERAIRQTSDELANTPVPRKVSPEYRRALRNVIDESFIASFRTVMLIAAGSALTSALCAGVMIRADSTARTAA